MCGHRSRTPYPSEGEIVECVEKARHVHRLQHLAAQEDHVRRQPAARSDPAPHPHRIHRIQHHGCFAISDGATVGAEIPSGVEAERRARRHTDFVVRDRTEDDGAGRSTETINDHGFARFISRTSRSQATPFSKVIQIGRYCRFPGGHFLQKSFSLQPTGRRISNERV